MALHLTWNEVQSCQKVLQNPAVSPHHYTSDQISFSYTSIMKLQLMYLDRSPTSVFTLAVLSARTAFLANISMPHSVTSFRPLLILPRSPFLPHYLKYSFQMVKWWVPHLQFSLNSFPALFFPVALITSYVLFIYLFICIVNISLQTKATHEQGLLSLLLTAVSTTPETMPNIQEILNKYFFFNKWVKEWIDNWNYGLI